MRFDRGGFPANYDVVFDGARRGEQRYAFGRTGKRIEEYDFESRWGTPLVLTVEPGDGAHWVGAFAAGGLGVVRGVYATPSPEHVCAIVDGLAYIVDVRAPEHGAAIASQAVVAVFAIRDAPMLVLAGDFDLVGVGPGKVAWSRPRLVVDHLRVLRTSADAIVCTGDIGGDKMGTITLSPQTGEIWESGA